MARILIIDDLPTAREVLVTLLGGHGHVVFAASDGVEGLALALLEQPDLIITDILMPQARSSPRCSRSGRVFSSRIPISTHTGSARPAPNTC